MWALEPHVTGSNTRGESHLSNLAAFGGASR